MSINISTQIYELEKSSQKPLAPYYAKADEVCAFNSQKVLEAFIKNRITTETFNEVTGYGFYDGGRDKVEALFADVFGAEDALVRPQIMSGTNAIWLSLSGLLHYGDTLLSISGLPYDPLQNMIGIAGDSKHSLMKNGVKYHQIELVDNDFDYPAIEKFLKENKVAVVAIQRSRGYNHREGLSIAKIEKVCNLIKAISPNIIIFADNCYGEFVETKEPTQVGVDVMAGSLMHNAGGGIATSGGYIVGKENLVYEIAERLTAPCIGKDLGANYNQHNKFLRGIFMAPQTVANAIKTAVFASYMFEKLGFKVSPRFDAHRTDIVQTVELGTQENLEKFCAGIQMHSPIDAFATPIPCEFPGYPHDEIMAAGTFTNGSTIELTCDAPVIPPYTAFMQGSLTLEYGKLIIMRALTHLMKG
ncbi:MAG: methionine gamma-lyase family protein [Clostridia bacterium]|nr:methionine gamma-lyase family protein [Clostridia bacterium]